MKTISMSLIAIVCLLAGGLLAAQDNQTERAAVNLSKPGQPVLLKASLINGGISVRVHDRQEVIVESKPSLPRHDPDGEEKNEDAEATVDKHPGMKRIAGGSASLTIEEKDNVVAVEAESWKAGCDLTIYVPLHTSLKLECVNGGDIQVDGVDGEIEAENVNGGITLLRVAGSVVAGTTNGKVVCVFTRVDPAKPISFSSFNGDVDVTFPAAIKATVRLKTQNGDVYSDFDVNVQTDSERQTEDKRDKGGRYKVVFDKAVSGAINGGGVKVKLETFNGDILLRRAK